MLISPQSTTPSPSVVAADDLAGGVAVVRDGANLTRHTAGYSDVDARTGFAPNTHIRAASITKTFVAATVLQLVAEGRVNLDALIETYLPGRIRGDGNDANAITEYFDDVTPPPVEPTTADQLLDAALAKPAQFAPGTAMQYTNTNYVIAHHRAAGLFETYFPALGDTGLRAPFAHGYG